MEPSTIQMGSRVTLKADPRGQRTLERTVVGMSTGQSIAVVKSDQDRWWLCRWQFEGQFHTDTFNEKELKIIS